MHAFFGLVLLVISAVISGILLGAMFVVVTTSINNLIVGPFFGASTGTYSFWIKFYMGMGGAGGLFISIIWGMILVYKKMAAH